MEIFALTDPRIAGSGNILTIDETKSLTDYLLADGSRDLAGNWSLGGFNLTSAGNITGTDIDISAGTGDYSSSGTIAAGATTLQGQLIVDVDSTEALLLRQDGDAGDIFAIDTTNTRMTFNDTPASTHSIKLTALGGVANAGDAGKQITITSGSGSDKTDTAANVASGGGRFEITVGDGGDANSGGTLNFAGNAGSFAFTGGAGGSVSSGAGVAGNSGGDGTTMTFTGGLGGSAVASTTSNAGGDGGTVSFNGGNGGTSTSGTARTGGDGGGINFIPGQGGITSGGTDGSPGIITLGDGGSSTFMTVERDADTYWTGDSTGLPYGHMYVDGTQVIRVALTMNTPTEVEGDGTGGTATAEDGWLAGDLNLMTFPTGGTEHHVTITKPGVYHITWNLSFKMVTGAANTQIHAGLTIDSTTFRRDRCEAHRTISNNSDTGNMSGSCMIDLPNGNEELSLWMENTTNSNDADVSHGSLTVIMVGGT